MRKQVINRKISILEFYRFIASVMIVLHHAQFAGINYSFAGNTYVEFFLIVTGYFTTKHFFEIKADSNKIWNGITYTISKISMIAQYSLLVTVVAFIIENVGSGGWFYYGEDFAGALLTLEETFNLNEHFVTDVLLVSDSYSPFIVAPLWYVGALLFVLPVFCYLVQIPNRGWVFYISFLYPILFYGSGLLVPRGRLLDLFRVLAGLCMGTFIYEAKGFAEHVLENWGKLSITLLEIICFCYPIISLFMNIYTIRMDYICFMVCILITVSGKSYTARISSRFLNYLGAISLPLYVVHWLVCIVIRRVTIGRVVQDTMKLIVLFAISIFCAIGMHEIVSLMRRSQHSKQRKE